MRVETGMLPVRMEDFEVMAPVDIDEECMANLTGGGKNGDDYDTDGETKDGKATKRSTAGQHECHDRYHTAGLSVVVQECQPLRGAGSHHYRCGRKGPQRRWRHSMLQKLGPVAGAVNWHCWPMGLPGH